MTQGLSVLTGMSAGATESVVVVPFELVKIRLQCVCCPAPPSPPLPSPPSLAAPPQRQASQTPS
jgi:hypothetical protein